MGKRMHFHTGEFARLCGVNRRTLHYYDEEGIFSPEGTEENGYRSYSARQIYPFYMIRLMRQMGLELSEIKEYMAHRSPKRLDRLLSEQLEWLLSEQRKLKAMQRTVENQRRLLMEAGRIVCDRVERLSLPAQTLFLSRSVRRLSAKGDTGRIERVIAEHMRYAIREGITSGYAFGARVAREDFIGGRPELIDAFFTPTESPYGRLPKDLRERRPAGEYLVTYFSGDYMATGPAYGRLLAYLKEHPELTPGAYSYEESIIEDLAAASPKDYITRIALLVEETEKRSASL